MSSSLNDNNVLSLKTLLNKYNTYIILLECDQSFRVFIIDVIRSLLYLEKFHIIY